MRERQGGFGVGDRSILSKVNVLSYSIFKSQLFYTGIPAYIHLLKKDRQYTISE